MKKKNTRNIIGCSFLAMAFCLLGLTNDSAFAADYTNNVNAANNSQFPVVGLSFRFSRPYSIDNMSPQELSNIGFPNMELEIRGETDAGDAIKKTVNIPTDPYKTAEVELPHGVYNITVSSIDEGWHPGNTQTRVVLNDNSRPSGGIFKGALDKNGTWCTDEGNRCEDGIYPSLTFQPIRDISAVSILSHIDIEQRPLAGAKYSLVNNKGVTPSNLHIYSADKIDMADIVSSRIGDVVIDNLPFGEYTIKEVQTPAGYAPTKREQNIVLNAGRIYEKNYRDTYVLGFRSGAFPVYESVEIKGLKPNTKYDIVHFSEDFNNSSSYTKCDEAISDDEGYVDLHTDCADASVIGLPKNGVEYRLVRRKMESQPNTATAAMYFNEYGYSWFDAVLNESTDDSHWVEFNWQKLNCDSYVVIGDISEYNDMEKGALMYTAELSRDMMRLLADKMASKSLAQVEFDHVAGRELSAKISWDDLNNKYSSRPQKILVSLRSNDKIIDSVEISSEDGWEKSFGAFPIKDENGETINYSIETSIGGYAVKLSEAPMEGVFNITARMRMHEEIETPNNPNTASSSPAEYFAMFGALVTGVALSIRRAMITTKNK